MTKARHQPHYKYHCHIANFPPPDWEKPRPCRSMQHREGIKEYASISPTSWTATRSIVSPNCIYIYIYIEFGRGYQANGFPGKEFTAYTTTPWPNDNSMPHRTTCSRPFNNQVVTGLPARLNLKSLEAVRSVNAITSFVDLLLRVASKLVRAKIWLPCLHSNSDGRRLCIIQRYVNDNSQTPTLLQTSLPYCELPATWLRKPRPRRPMQHWEGTKDYVSDSPTSRTATCSIRLSPNRKSW